jgi:hypothetical protein
MSTGLECSFIELANGEHYYLLERGDAPRNAWDWREYADAFGPFASFDAAYQHLSDNHCNPGGYSSGGAPIETPDEVLQRLLDNAEKPEPRRRAYSGYGRFGF